MAEIFPVPTRGIGTPDYTPQALQEPWIASAPLRTGKTAGWIYTHIAIAQVIPSKGYLLLGSFTAAQLETLGIESILNEVWVADNPNIYCRCFVGGDYITGTMICSPLGCSPVFLYPAYLTDASLPYSCNAYDAELNRYGVICRFRKDIGRGYSIYHYLYNDDIVDHNLIIAGISYQRKIVVL